jgi:DNA-binding XRE family transcriptional regulator
MAVAIETAAQRIRVELDQELLVERAAFAAKVRAARAVLDLSQDQLAKKIGLTQKSIHRIEQGSVQPTLRTIVKIQRFWAEQGISFENLRNGGFRLAVESHVLLRDRDGRHQPPHLTLV